MARTYWKTKDEWICALHLPSIGMPASEGGCFFEGCPSVRPSGRPGKDSPVASKAVEPVVSAPKKDTVASETAPKKKEAASIDVADLCSWKDCDKGEDGGAAPRKKRSKYCSRDCSNKNARWRHKQRKE